MIVIVVLVLILLVLWNPGKATKNHKESLICTNCGSVGEGKKAIRGNFLTELILWLFFLIPGIIYSIWRTSSNTTVCLTCGASNLIPLDSPKGIILASSMGALRINVSAGEQERIRQLEEMNNPFELGSLFGPLLVFGLVVLGLLFWITQI